MSDEFELEAGSDLAGRYTVVKLLSSGGFSDVYLVKLVSNNSPYMAKVENSNTRDIRSVIKIEIEVMKALQHSPRHACQLFDEGSVAGYPFLVMTLVGQNLDLLRVSRPSKCFNASTVIRVGVQCLEALQDLHKVGYVHRDVKPQNFATGRHPFQRTIYLTDFCLARRYKDSSGALRKDRTMAPFTGTFRYASVNAHLKIERSPHDDICSLMFSLKELRSGRLPWRALEREVAVLAKKVNLAKDTYDDEEWRPFKNMYCMAMDKSYDDPVDYDWFYKEFERIKSDLMVNDDAPYDWEASS